MIIRKSLNVKFPTVQYGNADLNVVVEISDTDFADLPHDPYQKAQFLEQFANWLLIESWNNEKTAVEQQARRFYDVSRS